MYNLINLISVRFSNVNAIIIIVCLPPRMNYLQKINKLIFFFFQYVYKRHGYFIGSRRLLLLPRINDIN